MERSRTAPPVRADNKNKNLGAQTDNQNIDYEELSTIFKKHNIDLSAEELSKARRVGFHIGYVKNGEGEIEYTKPLPHIDFVDEGGVTSDGLTQVAAARITPSRAKPKQRPYRRLFAFGDMQIGYRDIDGEMVPLHDEVAMGVARLICKDLQPDVIVNLGDSVDMAELSRFAPDSTHFSNRTLQQAFNRVHNFYAELRADNPAAKIVEVDSNHNVRLNRTILKMTPQLWGLKQAGAGEDYPVLTYPYMANLKSLDVDWVGGYGAAEYVYNDDLVFIHGNKVRSNGSTADMLSKEYPETNIVAGHGHKQQMHTRTTRKGNYLTAVQVGALCRTDGIVPGYGTAVDDYGKPVPKMEEWQQSVLDIQDYGDGNYQFNPILIRGGRAYYEGKEYVIADATPILDETKAA